MNLQELMATLAVGTWALLWQPVGRAFGWWTGAGAFILGGCAGLVVGWLFAEWLNRLRPHNGRRGRTAVVLAVVVVGLVVFAALPVWAQSLVRAE